jgi:hypothetical protein
MERNVKGYTLKVRLEDWDSAMGWSFETRAVKAGSSQRRQAAKIRYALYSLPSSLIFSFARLVSFAPPNDRPRTFS